MDKLVKLKKMSLPKLLDSDLSHLNTTEIEYVEQRLLKVSKKRVKELKADSTARLSPALSRHDTKLLPAREKIKKRKTPIKNMRVKIYSNVVDLVKFLKDKDSTVKGATDTVNGLKLLVNRVAGTDRPLTDKQIKRFFRLWDKARELYGGENVPEVNKKGGSPVWRKLIELVKANKYVKNDDILEQLNKVITGTYEEKQKVQNAIEKEESKSVEIGSNYDEEAEEDDGYDPLS